METIAKLIRGIFFNDDGNVEKSTTDKIKDFLLIAFIVEHIIIGGLIYWVDDEPAETAIYEQLDD